MSQPLIISENYNAPIEKVWDAISQKNEMKVWYFDIPNFKLEKGSVFEFYEPGDGKKYLHRCEIIDFITNSFLSYTWTHPAFSCGITKVLWELENMGKFTQLKLTHSGLENIADAGEGFQKHNYEEGWKQILGISLKSFLEKYD